MTSFSHSLQVAMCRLTVPTINGK